MKSRPRTTVLYGGDSSEREISCLSGMAVSKALKGRGFEVADVDARDDFVKALHDARAEAAFLALHGEFGEDGQMQTILERLGVPYTGSGPDASRIGMNKPATKRLLIENGIPTPEYHIAGPADGEGVIQRAAEELGYPLVVKPSAGGSSLGVSIVHGARGLPAAVAKARERDCCILMEQFIPGREVTVGVLNGRALPPIEIRCHGFYDFTAKYTSGRTEYIVAPELPGVVAQALEEAALGTYACVGCMGAARVDARLDETNAPCVLEINTIPGLTATSLLPMAARAAGIEFGELCEMMIADAIEQHQSRTGGTVGEKKASA